MADQSQVQMTDPVQALERLADDFWTWRTITQPDSYDDLPRVERPSNWLPDWSSAAVADRRRAVKSLGDRHDTLDLSNEQVSVQVNGRLLGSALARAEWELELLRGWQRNPCFYIDQTLVPVYNLLLLPPPIEDARADAIVGLLNHVPKGLQHARENLAGHAAAPFARSALRLLARADSQLEAAMAALRPLLPGRHGAALPHATQVAVDALMNYRGWLSERLSSFAEGTSIGQESLAFFLHRVALLPYPVDEMRRMGEQERDRALAMQAILRRSAREWISPPADAASQIAAERTQERAVRQFYMERGILSQPDSLRHYHFMAEPAYLAPLTWLGVCDDLTSPSRIDDNAVRYIPEPQRDQPYFTAAAAADPRTAIVHEGVHAQQLALSWRHPDPARRHFYDSAPNEGIAFYNEELMMLAGLFDDAPASAEFIANAMRLRALRVHIDIALALGELTIDQAADHLAHAVPMDHATAWQEAVFFAGNPGQGLSYLIGKRQIHALFAACASSDDTVTLLDFHDRLWREGNVPLALQRWELLGTTDDVDEADRLAVA